MAERTLGDVPGLDELAPDSAVLPASYTYAEVNPLGEITVGDDPLALSGMGSSDPFAYNVGFLDEPQGGNSEGKGYVAQHDPMQSSYLPSYDSGSTSPVQTTSGSSYTEEQLANAQAIATAGEKVGATDRDIQVALMAAIVESGLKNLDYGDRDSVGLFQQRDAWGSFEERTNPTKAAEMFFLGGQGGQQGLLDIKDRDTRSMGDLAQDVQVSAYPERYAQHQADAALLFNSLGSTTSGGGKGDAYGLQERDGHTVDNLTSAALDAAAKEFGADFSIMQGSHSTDVAASGNTHAGGGVVDVSVANGDWVGAMTALRKMGFAAWVRNVDGFGQAGSGAHIHAVLIGDEQLSPEALTQVQSYLNNDDGLSGSRPDDGPRQFVNNRFEWGSPKPKNQGPTWRDQVTRQARAFVGTPFAWGGKDFSGIDTETMLHNIYSQVGVDLPLIGADLRRLGRPADVASSKPGDLIGWHDPQEGLRFGIYLANGQLVEAGGPGRVVQISELGTSALDPFGIPIEQLIASPEKTNPFSPRAPAPATTAPTPSTYRPPSAPPNKYTNDMAPPPKHHHSGPAPVTGPGDRPDQHVPI